MPYWVKTPAWVMRWLPQLVWQMPDKNRSIYLTFDDGPTPDVTDWVIHQLAAYHAKATFFCLGKQAVLHPQLLHAVQQAGHSIGNHTFHHLNGWKTPLPQYAQDVALCAEVVKSGLFRPPYGKITPAQANYLLQNPQLFYQNQSPRIIMWSVVSADWNNQLHWKKCLENVTKNVSLTASPYSPILVFHDSEKAAQNLKQVLPVVLEFYTQKGFTFKAIT